MCFLSLEVDFSPVLQGFFSFFYLVAHLVGSCGYISEGNSALGVHRWRKWGPRDSMHDTSAPKLLTDEAFAELLKRFQWPLYVFLRGFISDPEQSRDLVQDVFCDTWRAVQRAATPFDGLSDEKVIRR
jgi:hypothetical protein